MNKQITELRKSGKLQEAYKLASSQILDSPDNIWNKRALAWVLYEYAKIEAENKDTNKFFSILEEIAELNLPQDETIFGENITFTYGKWIYNNIDNNTNNHNLIIKFLELIKGIPLPRPSNAYSYLIKNIHCATKNISQYCDIMDHIEYSTYLSPNDYQNSKTADGKPLMSLAEQIYIAYAKHLITEIKGHDSNNKTQTSERSSEFLSNLSNLIQKHPEYTYTIYFKAKLLIALEQYENVSALLIPFVKNKSRDFWVWQTLGESMLRKDTELALACYCRALLCKNKEEMIVSLREETALLMLDNGQFAEAKYEIEQCIKTREKHWNKTNPTLEKLRRQEWFQQINATNNNNNFYNLYSVYADNIVWQLDIQSILICHVNKEKHTASYITSDNKTGFFKIEKQQKFNNNEVYNAVIHKKNKDSISTIKYYCKNNEPLKSCFFQQFSARVKLQEGKNFAFVGKTYVPPEIIKKYNLTNDMPINAISIKTYNHTKKTFGWKIIEVIL